MADQQMTPNEVAHKTGQSVDVIRRLIREGRLPATRVAGDRWLVDPAAVEQLVEKRSGAGR